MRNSGMNISKTATRVAALYLKAQQGQQQQGQQQQALPKSKPGLQMVKGKLDALNKAYDDQDTSAFDKALHDLVSVNRREAR